MRLIREKAGLTGGALHYRYLPDDKRAIACGVLADKPLRLFVMASNKKNMRGHRNRRAEKVRSQQWFYNFCVRLLLERITDYVERRSIADHGEPKHVQIVFSERGGHSYGHSIAYQEVLKRQSQAKTLILDKRDIKWRVVDRRLFDVVPHDDSAGAQLADIVTSAFFQAVDVLPPTRWNPNLAKLLLPRLAADHGVYADYGLSLQPTPPSRAKLTAKQEIIFRHYGYQF